MSERPKTIAFYLPQFYPIPENDGWYGEGFTEWRNVVTAKPLFEGHYQPHVPRDFGFYDLRVPEVREAQARAARQHGIDAFCYYHYWFHGHRPLKLVIDEVLAHGSPAIPFCLAWVNENWSRHWDATRHEVLLEQRYSQEDDVEHARFLLRALTHPLYLKIAGRPILFIYRIQAMPDARRTLNCWRDIWRAGGIDDVHIVKFDTHGNHEDPATFGADAAAAFLPHGVADTVPQAAVHGCNPKNHVWHYDDLVRTQLTFPRPAWVRYECVLPGWDNTPRRGDGSSLVIHGSTPERYEEWLTLVHERTPADGMVLLNAWNEWAEGAHLEPDVRHGREYLEATARAVGANRQTVPPNGHAGPSEPTLTINDRFADLYLDARENQTRLQRRLSRLEATFERQLQHAVGKAQEESNQLRACALGLTREIERLRAELRHRAAISAPRSDPVNPPETLSSSRSGNPRSMDDAVSGPSDGSSQGEFLRGAERDAVAQPRGRRVVSGRRGKTEFP